MLNSMPSSLIWRGIEPSMKVTMDRRAFVKLAAGSSTAMFFDSAWGGPAPDDSKVEAFPMHLVYDTRLVGMGTLPDVLLASAARVHPFAGDITPIWYEALHGLWQAHEITTIGITREAEFFVLSTLARDYGYDVSHQDEVSGSMTWMLAPAAGSVGRPQTKVRTAY